MKRVLLLAGAVLALTTSPSATAMSSPSYCLADFSNTCLVRPSLIPTGAHTYVKAIHWRSWDEANAVGFGRLIETGGCCNPSFNDRAKIRLSLPGECGNRIWYSRISINYGPRLDKRYLHNEDRFPC